MTTVHGTSSLDAAPADTLVPRRGWILVAALAAAQLVSAGTLFYGFPMFVLSMEAEFGWSRTALNGALGAGLLTSALAAYPVGVWIDRFGGRAPMALGSALAAVLFVAWSMVESLVAFYAIWIGLGLAMALTLYEPAFAVLVRLFAHSYRSKITALTLVGGFAGTIFVPVMQALIHGFGWREALFVLAAGHALIALPIHLGVLGEGRRIAAARPAQSEARPGALSRAARTPVFWGLLIAFLAYYAVASVLSFHLVPLLTERQYAPAVVAGIVAAVGPAQVAGRLALLALGRRAAPVRAGKLALLAIPAAVFLLIAVPESLPAMLAFALVYGAANGVMTIARGTAVADLLGREGFGAVNGAITLPARIAMAAAPPAAAMLWTATGGYSAVLWGMVILSCIAAAGLWFAVAAAAGTDREAGVRGRPAAPGSDAAQG